MAEKQILDRRQSADSVKRSVEAHKAEVEAGMSERYASLMAEGQQLAIGSVMDLVVRFLDGSADGMMSASSAHEAELADDKEPRRRRESALPALNSELVAFRGTVHQLLGPAGAEVLKVHTPVPGALEAKVHYGEQLHAALVDESLALPPSVVAGAALDRAAMGAALRPLLDDARAALDAVGREERELESTLAAKWAATEAYDEVFGVTARWLEATYHLAGLHEAAERLRPSRRPGRLAESTDGPEETPVAG